MNCLILGGGGFIGSHVAKALFDQGYHVVVFDQPGTNRLEYLENKGLEIAYGDFRSSSDLKKALQSIDTIYHFISTSVPQTSNEDIRRDIETNLIGTVNLLQLAVDFGVKKFLFASSGGTVYGTTKESPTPEDHPTNPISSYGIVKLAIEKYVSLFGKLYGLDYRILRMANAYGEGQASNGVQGLIPIAIWKAINNLPIEIWGDGTIIRDYIYISDIVDAFIKVSNYQGSERIFNIGTGIGISINTIMQSIDKLVDQPINVIYNEHRQYDVDVNVLNNDLARKELNWTPVVDIKTGLKKVYEYLSNRED